MEWIGYGAAILMGLSLGVIGGGGSILTVPILVYFFKQDALVATTGSLFVVGSTALTGALLNARRGHIDLKTGVTFAVPSFAGVFFARKIVLPLIPQTIALPLDFSLSKSLLVLLLFAVLMIAAARAMIRSGNTPQKTDAQTHSRTSVALKGFFVGCMTGFVGAGGGFLIIPALVLLLHIPMRLAVGTSLAIIAANSLFGFSISLGSTPIEWTVLLAITALGVAGLTVGHQISAQFPERQLKRIFGYFVLVLGLFIFMDQIRHLG